MTSLSAQAAPTNPPVPPAKGAEKPPAKGAEKPGDKPKPAGKEGGAVGRKSVLAGKRLFIKKGMKENPYREGGRRHGSFALVKEGMTFEDYAKASGNTSDLQTMVKHGNIIAK